MKSKFVATFDVSKVFTNIGRSKGTCDQIELQRQGDAEEQHAGGGRLKKSQGHIEEEDMEEQNIEEQGDVVEEEVEEGIRRVEERQGGGARSLSRSQFLRKRHYQLTLSA